MDQDSELESRVSYQMKELNHLRGNTEYAFICKDCDMRYYCGKSDTKK